MMLKGVTFVNMKLSQFVLLLLCFHYATSNEDYKLYLRRKSGNKEDKESLNAKEGDIKEVHDQEEKIKIGSNKATVVYEVDNIPVINANKKNKDNSDKNFGIGEVANKNGESDINARRAYENDDEIITVTRNNVNNFGNRASGLMSLFYSISGIINSAAKKSNVRQIIYDYNTKTMVVNTGNNRYKPYFIYVPLQGQSPIPENNGDPKANTKNKGKNRGKKTKKQVVSDNINQSAKERCQAEVQKLKDKGGFPITNSFNDCNLNVGDEIIAT